MPPRLRPSPMSLMSQGNSHDTRAAPEIFDPDHPGSARPYARPEPPAEAGHHQRADVPVPGHRHCGCGGSDQRPAAAQSQTLKGLGRRAAAGQALSVRRAGRARPGPVGRGCSTCRYPG